MLYLLIILIISDKDTRSSLSKDLKYSCDFVTFFFIVFLLLKIKYSFEMSFWYSRKGSISRCHNTWICTGWERLQDEQVCRECRWPKNCDWRRERPKGSTSYSQQALLKNGHILLKIIYLWKYWLCLDHLQQEAFGADVLRLWVSSVDYTGDVMIGTKVLRQMSDIYRKLRGTLRFLLGNLHDWKVCQLLISFVFRQQSL